MNSNVRVLCLPYHNTGAHFVDWSIHYLRGLDVVNDQQHFSNQNNWHHHHIEMASGHDALLEKITTDHQQLRTIYYGVKLPSLAVKELFDLRFETANPEQIRVAEQHVIDDYRRGIRACQDRNLVPVFFDYDSRDLASIYYNDRFPLDWYGRPSSKHDVVDFYNQSFYHDALEKFDGEIWDQRELCAITYRGPTPELPAVSDLIDQSQPHLYYTTDDVWHGFDRCIVEICDAWHIEIDQQRWQTWQKIYAQWRTVHDPWFSRHLPRIVDAVINNKYMSLKRFQMNFFMEVILQHELIAKHNLNLKTWQLTHFPDNAQDLHQLLEPSIHKL